MAAERLHMFGMTPRIALCSHSNFGSHVDDSSAKMRRVFNMLRERAPDLEVEGEMRADAALMQSIRERIFANSRLRGQANLLVMPNQDAANIAFTMARDIVMGVTVDTILQGIDRPS